MIREKKSLSWGITTSNAIFAPLNRSQLIDRLPAGYVPERLITPEQDVSDIMQAVRAKHTECAPLYDKICRPFLGADLWETCERLFDFCKTELSYDQESVDRQVVSAPQTILRRGTSDCKCYALFIGGCLDALQRAGLIDCDWCYRFASYYMFDPGKHHVFVVVSCDEGTIWVDPVLDELDERMPWPIWKTDKEPYGYAASMGRIPGVGQLAAIGSAESDLLSELLQYQQGVVSAIKVSKQTGTLNSISTGVLQGASNALPAIVPVLGALKAAGMLVNDVFPPGSAAARIATDIENFNVVGLFNDVFNGRTYNTDQYWGAAFYYWYVEGKDITNQNQVTDDQVIPALKWFIDRTGVFISGREHIMALINGAQKYISYAGVNGDTTTDMSLVGPAVAVAQQYWLLPTRTPSGDYQIFDPALKGSWRRTIGVFDGPLADIAHQLGLTLEQAGNEQRARTLPIPVQPQQGLQVDPVLVVGGVALLGALYFLFTD